MSAETKHAGHAVGAAQGAHGAHEDEAAHIRLYTKVYLALLGLFLVSVTGPFVGAAVGSKALVLITAFGIALVKAYLVCAHFMHLNIEKRFIGYLLTTAVVFMLLFYAGVAPDVMEHHGRNWQNLAAQSEVQRALKEHAEHPEHGAGEHAEH
jgi:caa(3)-type oxidase subunit IV